MDIPKLTDGQSIADMFAEAKQRNQPIMLFFSQQNCLFCETLREDVLIPLLVKAVATQTDSESLTNTVSNSNSDVGSGIIFREAHYSLNPAKTEQALIDLKHQYAANFFPSLLFIGKNKQEISERHIGYQPNNDLAGYYIDQAILQAKKRASEI